MAAKDDAKPPQVKKGSNLIKVLLIVIGAVLLIGGSVGATLFLTGALQKKNEEAAPTAASSGAAHGEAGYSAPGAVKPSPPKLYQLIEPAFIVNFEDQGVLRYLQIGLSVMTRDKLVVDAITNNMPQIRNDLILLFANQKVETLSTNEGKEKLRTQAMEKVQAILTKEIGYPGIEAIYFTAFVLQ
ncbi:MAG: flagellar basal body-associated FliL family protein [Candidatus Competibacteraceae bacterium]